MRLRPWTLGLLGLALGCGRKSAEEEPAPPHVPVEVALVAKASLGEELEVVGHLRPVPGGSALLSAPAAGVVKALAAQAGSRVAAGALVLELDIPELTATLRQLAAAADLAARDEARAQRLFGQGLTARKEVERAGAATASAQAALDAAQQLAKRSQVTSPLAGVVQRVMVQVGERVEAGAALVEIVDGSSLELAGTVPAARLGELKPGQAVTVSSDDGIGLRGTVFAVLPAVDTMTNSGQVVIRVPNGSGAVRPGASARGRVALGHAASGLVVPAAAVVLVGGADGVFVVGADSVAHAKPVTVGIHSGELVQVAGDLAVGDRVVVVGAYGLADGMHVIPSVAGETKATPEGKDDDKADEKAAKKDDGKKAEPPGTKP